jgi:hypothetical protein
MQHNEAAMTRSVERNRLSPAEEARWTIARHFAAQSAATANKFSVRVFRFYAKNRSAYWLIT